MKLNKEFWVARLGNGWAMKLQETLKSDYMNRLMTFLSVEAAMKQIYPAKQDVFRAFAETPWEEVKVVILGDSPYYTENSSTGLAYANLPGVLGYDLPLIKIYEAIERDFYDGLCLDFDWSMWRWANQGVLMLNTALTVQHGISNSHKKPWERFTKEVIKALNENSTGIVFMLWGPNAKKYDELIGEHHHVLTYEHPADAVQQRRDWKCPHFIEANEILNDKYGEEIKW